MYGIEVSKRDTKLEKAAAHRMLVVQTKRRAYEIIDELDGITSTLNNIACELDTEVYREINEECAKISRLKAQLKSFIYVNYDASDIVRGKYE